MVMSAEPQEDHDHTVHALNIHGTFFERWCQQIVVDSSKWRLDATNYPVAYHRSGELASLKESALDIRAFHGPASNMMRPYRSLTLLIECKKNNPEFIEWVFFPSRSCSIFFQCVEVKSTQTNISDSQSRTYPRRIEIDLEIADKAPETRGNYKI